jgi:hypothetical protein
MIRLFVKPLIALRVFRRSMLVKAAGKIRLLHEVKTGDPLFDAEFAVFANDAVSARSYLQQTAVRQGLRALLEYGIWKAGAVFCPINFNFRGKLLSYQINDTKPRLMIAEQSLIPLLNDIKGDIGKTDIVLHVPSRDEHDYSTDAAVVELDGQFPRHAFSEMLASSKENPGDAQGGEV